MSTSNHTGKCRIHHSDGEVVSTTVLRRSAANVPGCEDTSDFQLWSHRDSCYYWGCIFPLLTFLIEGNATFHVGVSEDENVLFPIQVHRT